MMHWLRRSFLTGFFLIVPLFVSVAALVWLFRLTDGLMGPIYARLLGRPVPGLGVLTTAAVLLIVGAVATNVIGKRLLQRAEHLLMMVPVFKTIYSPVKQLTAAFNPDNEYGFKRVVMIEESQGRVVLGFLTREFVAEQDGVTRDLVAVYVPTNHLYLGDVLVYRRDAICFPDISVEEGVRIFLTGGMALAGRVRARREHPDTDSGPHESVTDSFTSREEGT